MSGAHRDSARLAPALSSAEREALGAGTVWIEGELFSGRPDLRRLAAEPWPTALPEREQAFLDGAVEEVCAMVDPWRLDRERELPPEVWAYLRRHGFFGLSIPRRWGGLEFSALGRTAVFGKLAARSLPLSAVVLIPNSVGPGELLVEYGTEAQRERWLPRLARGEEIPCFALTEPEAGSDAAALSSRGVLFRDPTGPGGEPMLRLDFDKRYITLAPVATLIGLAFRLEDPEGLLAEVGDEQGGGGVPGITVALVPAATPGVEIGRRHDPMGLPLPNGPIRGRGVVVPASAILGGLGLEGRSGAGRGWRMLMETLAGGRALSLPAQAAAGAKHVARVAGAYCAVRRQFGRPVAAFGGVEERLAAIAGRAYLLDAVRVWTAAAIDGGERPAVLSAAVKVLATEEARAAVADGMDVMGGAAICRGPKNLLADGWIGAPIGITVEGANILTRSLIVFGQGALRCHPRLGRLLAAAGCGRWEQARALAGFLGGMAGNGLRAGWLALTRGFLLRVPAKAPAARWWRRLARASARFAWTADLALATLGPAIKRREQVSGRLADALTWMIACAAVLRRFEAEAGSDPARRAEDRPLLDGCAAHALSRVQQALEGVCRNLGGRGAGRAIGLWLRGPGLWALRLDPIAAPPSDRLGAEAAAAITRPGARRDRLIAGLPTGAGRGEALARLEEAFLLAARAEVAGAEQPGSEAAAEALAAADAARAGVIAADAFDPEEYLRHHGHSQAQAIARARHTAVIFARPTVPT